jgi:hypothetical protein
MWFSKPKLGQRLRNSGSVPKMRHRFSGWSRAVEKTKTGGRLTPPPAFERSTVGDEPPSTRLCELRQRRDGDGAEDHEAMIQSAIW